jgi:hypothetical protein
VPGLVLIFQFVFLVFIALVRQLEETLLPLHERCPPRLLVLDKLLVLVLRGPVCGHRLGIRLILYRHGRGRRFERRRVVADLVLVVVEMMRVLMREAVDRAPVSGRRCAADLRWRWWWRWKDAARVG